MKFFKKKKTRSAVILCGGKGTRLGHITKKIPKSLVQFKGKPIIWYIIKILKKNNFNHFIFPIGYRGNLLKKYLNKEIFKEYNFDIIETGLDTPIAKRIFKIKKFIKSENFLLLNGDAIFNINLDKIYQNHIKRSDTFITFLGSETNLPYGTVILSKGVVKNFQRNVMFNAVKITDKQNNTAYVYSGMAILKKKILTKNIKNLKNFESDLYPAVIKKYKCKFEKFNGFWHSVDNIKDIKIFKDDKNKKSKLDKLFKKIK